MNDYFMKLKSNLELDATLAGLIQTRHQAVRDYIKNNHHGQPDSKLIGSHQRQTRIRPIEGHPIDIDIIVVLGQFYNWVQVGGVTPEAALQSVHSVLSGSPRYGDMHPVQDAPTIQLTSQDNVKVEVVPAYIDQIGVDPAGNPIGSKGRGYWIAREGRWQMADYDHEAEYISAQNQLSGGYLIPTTKMLKAIKRHHFRQLNSFSLEILAASIVTATVRGRTLLSPPVTYPELLLTFLERAPLYLASAIQIPGSKSVATVLDTATQQTLADVFGQIAAFIRSIDAQTSIQGKVEAWRRLFGDSFPATI